MKRVLIAFCIWLVLMLMTVTLISQPVIELGIDAPIPSFKVATKAALGYRLGDVEALGMASHYFNYGTGVGVNIGYRFPGSYTQGDWGQGFLVVAGAGYTILTEQSKNNGGQNFWHPIVGIKQCISGTSNTYWSIMYQSKMFILGVGFRIDFLP